MTAWDYFRKIGESTQPVAYWGSPLGDLDWVSSDNEAGARLAADHLAAKGCKDLVCVGSRTSMQRQFAERADAFLTRAKELGLKARLVNIEPGKERREQGRMATEAMLAEGNPCDGIFAVCDALAFGVIDALQAAGKVIPDDIKLIGFDGIPAGELTSPTLTTIEPDLDQAGRMLVEAVTSAAEVGRQGHQVRRVPVKLLERASA
jgi:DNA-binding LacI/PurR family transcriptional regulator